MGLEVGHATCGPGKINLPKRNHLGFRVRHRCSTRSGGLNTEMENIIVVYCGESWRGWSGTGNRGACSCLPPAGGRGWRLVVGILAFFFLSEMGGVEGCFCSNLVWNILSFFGIE